MYERFYQLRECPFALTPDPDYLFLGRVHEEALGYLRYGLETQAGFIVITGDIGSGKTTLLQAVLRGLDRQTTVAHLVHTLLAPEEFLEAVTLELGLDPSVKSKPARLRELGRFLANQRREGRLILLVVDEAQNLAPSVLEEIRLLTNLETDKSKLIQVVLAGQPELGEKLERPELEQLRQRVTVRYHLPPLDAEQTGAYINHRLRRASAGPPLQWPKPVTDLIHAQSGGVPRLINVICDATLVFGYAADRRAVDVDLVEAAWGELRRTGVLRPAGVGSAASGGVTRAEAPPAGGRQAQGIDAALHERLEAVRALEAGLHGRAAEIARRERQVAGQARALSEEYRLLRAQRAMSAEPGSPWAAWPPARVEDDGDGNQPPVDTHGRPPTTQTTGDRSTPPGRVEPPLFLSHASHREGIWRRLVRALAGTPLPG